MELFFIYILKSSGALFLFFATYKIFLQKETFFNSNRIFLMLGIIVSLVIPFIEFTRTIYVEATQVNNISFLSNSNSEVLVEDKIDWQYMIISIYLLGVLFFSLRFIIQLLSLYKLISKGKLHKNDGYKHVETKQNTSPFSFFNYIVYNPEHHTEEEIKTIIEHEKIHSSQKHSIDIIGAHLLTIFQWVNPTVWLYKKAIAQNLEYIADNESVKTILYTKDYQYLLLKQTTSNYNLSITNTFFNLLIKKRIVMLNKNKSHKQNALKYGIIIPLLAVFIILFNVKTIAQTKVIVENNNSLTENKLIEFNINKNKSDNELEKLAKKIKTDYNQSLIFNKIKRNSNGIITDIDFKYGDKKGFITGNNNNEAGIPNIRFGTNNGELFISFGKMTDPNHNLKNTLIKIENNNPIHILNGKKVSKEKFEKLNLTPDKIESINVLKDEKAIAKYGKEAKNGVIEITTKNKIHKDIGHDEHLDIDISGDNPIYILDGKKISKEKFEEIKNTLDLIEKIEVSKGEEAIAKYGDEAKDGVVEITTKKNNDKNFIVKGMSDAGVIIDLDKDTPPPLFILKGKEITEMEMKKIKPENIKEIKVLKGEAAIKKYGKKAKDGVVEITTKK